jgi:hypothetical protein
MLMFCKLNWLNIFSWTIWNENKISVALREDLINQYYIMLCITRNDQNLDAIAFLNTYIDKTHSEIAWHQMDACIMVLKIMKMPFVLIMQPIIIILRSFHGKSSLRNLPNVMKKRIGQLYENDRN